MESSKSKLPMAVSANMESGENHIKIFQKVMQIFALGQKISKERLKAVLIKEYQTRQIHVKKVKGFFKQRRGTILPNKLKKPRSIIY